MLIFAIFMIFLGKSRRLRNLRIFFINKNKGYRQLEELVPGQANATARTRYEFIFDLL